MFWALYMVALDSVSQLLPGRGHVSAADCSPVPSHTLYFPKTFESSKALPGHRAMLDPKGKSGLQVRKDGKWGSVGGSRGSAEPLEAEVKSCPLASYRSISPHNRGRSL